MNYVKPLILSIFLPFMTAAACDGQIQCDICLEEHSTASHVEEEAPRTGGMLPAETMANDEVLLAFVRQHRGDGFVRVNDAPYASAVSQSRLNVFVSEFALPEYLETAPEHDDSEGMIPRGSFVVREIVDHAGEVTKLTALYRGPEGYNPTSGDFWFAVTDPDGKVLVDEAGKAMSGPLESCSGCHSGRASSDYLFGVPTDARSAEFAPALEPAMPETDSRREDPEEESEQEQPEVEEPEQPMPEAPTVDLGGWSIANIQSDLSREQSAHLSALEVPEDSVIVIARNASRAEFEAYWGAIPDEAVFVNQRQSGGFEAPIVNGDETWVLRAASGVTIDGPTPVGVEGASYERSSAAQQDWRERDPLDADPGVVSPTLPRGVWLTEWSDAEDYRYEFVEIAVR